MTAAIPITRPVATERQMLDLLNTRYGKLSQSGFRYGRAKHVRSQAGFAELHNGMRCADYIAFDLWNTRLAFHGHEVKVSRSDWLNELKRPEKAAAFIPFMHYWWLVVPGPVVAVVDELPTGWGLMYRSGGRLLVQRQAALNPDVQPMPVTMLAAFTRAVAKTAARIGVPAA